jgi:hypothetical protein
VWVSLGATAAIVVVVGVVPLALDRDSFPLSTYPMFAYRRPEARVTLHYVIAVGEGGARRHVPPDLVANAEVMQAMMTVRRAVDRGQTQQLCAEVAARVARHRDFDRMDTVQVVFGDHRAVAYLLRGVHGPERLLARCAIPRGPRGPR